MLTRYLDAEGNYGFVKITDPRKYNLTGGLPLDVDRNMKMPERYQVSGEEKNDTEVYVISMFHQLHCLVNHLSSLSEP
jgi:hypothetical protein